jgi:hypothetical protein
VAQYQTTFNENFESKKDLFFFPEINNDAYCCGSNLDINHIYFSFFYPNRSIWTSSSLRKLKLKVSFMKFLKLLKGCFKNTVCVPSHEVAQKLPTMLLVTEREMGLVSFPIIDFGVWRPSQTT